MSSQSTVPSGRPVHRFGHASDKMNLIYNPSIVATIRRGPIQPSIVYGNDCQRIESIRTAEAMENSLRPSAVCGLRHFEDRTVIIVRTSVGGGAVQIALVVHR